MSARMRRRRIASWQATLAIALLLLGFLIAAQVSAQAPAAATSSLERPGLVQTIQDLQNRHDELAASIVATRSQLAAVRQGGQGRQSDLVTLNEQLQQAQLAAGFTTIQGAGGYVYLSDGSVPPGIGGNPADYRVDAADIRTIVNGLWRSGAEAIAINKERVVTTTAVVDVGGSILANSAYVTDGSGQYVISVIGPSDMWTKLSSLDTFRTWMEQRYGPFHLAIQYVADSKVLVLGYAGTANLHIAQVSPAPSEQVSPAPSGTP
jgi:uncharacterized protein YlxW (UPF0749 family)